MKHLFTLIFLMTTLFSFGQDSTTYDNVVAMNTTLVESPTKFAMSDYSNTNYKIDLKLSKKSSSRYYDEDEYKKTYLGIFIGGLAFTTAAILEGSYQYGTWKSTGPNTATYVTPSFWQQTPRQIMLCVGVGLTLTGGGLLISHK